VTHGGNLSHLRRRDVTLLVKVRCYFRYKGIPHQWILRNARLDKTTGKKT
jgi:hypothetical protein